VAIFTYPGAQVLDVTGPSEVFAIASDTLSRARGIDSPAYRVEILAPSAGPVRMSSGLQLVADRAFRSVRGPLDTLLLSGGRLGLRDALADLALLPWLRRMAGRVRRLGSVCTGAFFLAEAGLLDGRRATTHWSAAQRLADRYPRIDVDPDAIYVRDGSVVTSAGVTAGMDLALALVEEDWGREVALGVARRLVVFLKRPGGQSQFSAHLEAQSRASGALAGLPAWVAEHLDEDLGVAALAARFAMSPRNFARVFTRELGVTPAKYVERARLERARACLEDGRRSLEEVAVLCGFGSEERMRKTFLRQLRVLPREYRRCFSEARNEEEKPWRSQSSSTTA
jgi:transcriptional regulator GlxA family with amidase domain